MHALFNKCVIAHTYLHIYVQVSHIASGLLHVTCLRYLGAFKLFDENLSEVLLFFFQEQELLFSDWPTGQSHISSTERLGSRKLSSPPHRLVICSSTFEDETCRVWCGCLRQKSPATSPSQLYLGQPLPSHQNPPLSCITPTSLHSEVFAPFLPALDHYSLCSEPYSRCCSVSVSGFQNDFFPPCRCLSCSLHFLTDWVIAPALTL